MVVPCFRIENFRWAASGLSGCSPHGGTEIQGIQVKGILGQDFLTKFNFILDYQSQTITFEENEEFAQSLSGGMYVLLHSPQRKLVLIPPQSHESHPSLLSPGLWS